jgi:hypothetical protein
LGLAEELIDRMVFYYDDGELLEMAEDPQCVAVVASILAAGKKSKVAFSKEQTEEAKKYITEYIDEYYL